MKKHAKLKLLALVSLLFFFSAIATAQEKSITINVKNVSLKEVFNVIEKQTTYRFSYRNVVVDSLKNFSISKTNTTVSAVLDEIFAGRNLTYSIVSSKSIVISEIQVPSGAENEGNRSSLNYTGIIVDEKNEPVIGGSVVVKGGQIGTVTDTEGKFSIKAPAGSTLVISYIGFVTQEIKVSNQTHLQITLVEDINYLDEVVVVGFGVMRKRDVLGSISTVKTNDLALATTSSIAGALGGKAAGLLIRQNSAQPGGGLDIIIRGQGSVNASNAPLIIIDGFPISELQQPGSGNRYDAGTTSILNSFNPNDIESIEVLKDASSTAIYGARAANGVILITTKRGKTGKPAIEYSSNFSIQQYEKSFDVLPLNEWMQVRNEAAWEDWNFQNRVYPYGNRTLEEAQANPVGTDFRRLYTQNAIDNVGRGTDWFDLIIRSGTIQQHNLSLSGGNENTKYLISGNYYNHRGGAALI